MADHTEIKDVNLPEGVKRDPQGYPVYMDQTKIPGAGKPAIPGNEPSVYAWRRWSEPEKWAWSKIARGERADFNSEERLDYNPGNLPDDPSKAPSCPLPWEAEAWEGEKGERRKLSASFLKTILTIEPWRGALTKEGVCISGVMISDKINLNDALISCAIALDYSLLDNGIDLDAAVIRGSVYLEGTSSSRISMQQTRVNGSLYLDEGRFAECWLRLVEVEGNVIARGFSAYDVLDIRFSKIGGSMLFFGAIIDLLLMDGIQIGGKMDAEGILLAEGLVAIRASIKEDLILDNAEVNTADFEGSMIGGTVMANNANFKEISMERANVGNDLKLSGANSGNQCGQPTACHLNIEGLHLGGNLQLAGAALSSLDASYLYCEHGVVLCDQYHEAIKWLDNALCTIRHARVGWVRDSEDAWPSQIDIDGFEYRSLGGDGSSDKATPQSTRPVGWYSNWLKRTTSYSPQPYEECAKALRAAGRQEDADTILYYGIEQKRKRLLREHSYARALNYYFSKLIMGYGIGYRYLRALPFAATVWLIGVLVAMASKGWATDALAPAMGYSLDMIVPLLDLDKSGDLLRQFGGAYKYWFMFQQVFGYVFAPIVVAGYTGILGLRSGR